MHDQIGENQLKTSLNICCNMKSILTEAIVYNASDRT